ncbi:MAG: hypothetical protein FJ077_14905 [Cyanobacteria bacterium K_DeepCast_35m_m2_023]|nr:hypothetical protein [Cyanobacteria bacterium K_DeepCast_35m_m2_023]
MALNQHTRRLLQDLGRRLPQPLPQPSPSQQQPAAGGSKQHRIETETDPEILFRELMRASPDGSVPPHLMERLRHAEQQRLNRQRPAEATPAQGSTKGRASRSSDQANRLQRKKADTQDPLHVEFEQMLLEDDDG